MKRLLTFVFLATGVSLASAQTTQIANQGDAQSGAPKESTAKASQKDDKPSSLDVINNMINTKGSLFFKNAQTKPSSEKRPTNQSSDS